MKKLYIAALLLLSLTGPANAKSIVVVIPFQSGAVADAAINNNATTMLHEVLLAPRRLSIADESQVTDAQGGLLSPAIGFSDTARAAAFGRAAGAEYVFLGTINDITITETERQEPIRDVNDGAGGGVRVWDDVAITVSATVKAIETTTGTVTYSQVHSIEKHWRYNQREYRDNRPRQAGRDNPPADGNQPQPNRANNSRDGNPGQPERPKTINVKSVSDVKSISHFSEYEAEAYAALFECINTFFKDIFNMFPLKGVILQTNPDERNAVVDIGSTDGLAEGDRLYVFRDTGNFTNSRTGEEVEGIPLRIGVVRVVQVGTEASVVRGSRRIIRKIVAGDLVITKPL